MKNKQIGEAPLVSTLKSVSSQLTKLTRIILAMGTGGSGGSTVVLNNLTSTSTTSALAANQGRVLKGLIDAQQQAITENSAKVSNVNHPLVETAVPIGALFTDTDTVYDDTIIQAEVDLNTLKETNIVHPLVETAVPSGAVFTDTVYDDTALSDAVALNTLKETNIAHPLVETAVPLGAIFTDTQLTQTDIEAMGFVVGGSTPGLQAVTEVGNTTTLNINVASVNDLNLYAQVGVDKDNIGIGIEALLNNTGINSSGIGTRALYNNTGKYAYGFGFYALHNNTGTYSNGFGSNALTYNTGDYSNGIGYSALQSNTGTYVNGFGSYAVHNNTGDYSNGIGNYSLANNNADNTNAFGDNALKYTAVTSSDLTAIGHNSSVGSLTPVDFVNSTSLGANSNMTKSNQVVLGDANVTEVVMGNGDVIYPTNRIEAIAIDDIDLQTAEDFTKTCGTDQSFTLSNVSLRKPFRMELTGGNLLADLFPTYTLHWLAGSSLADYIDTETNYLYCEVRTAGEIFCFFEL